MFFRISTKKEFLLILAIISAIVLINIDSRKKKKKPKAPKKPFNPKDRKPVRINDNLYCEMCRAVVKETTRSLYNKRKDYEVIEAIEKVCDSENSEYIFPHSNEYPIRKDACDVFVASWNEELETILVNRKDDESPINELCFDVTKACDFDFKASNPVENEYALDEDKLKKDEI